MMTPRLTLTTEDGPLCLIDCLTRQAINLAAFHKKPLFRKRRWRVSMREGEEPLATCERGGYEASRVERSIAAKLEDGPQADSEAEETSPPGVTVGQSESR
ncbi:hypothetical protein E2C01_035979 [Portunus trituberculatus]|uniref:Uncharacterized protein n=1 Tax=Portunus trituberculatus TaxID=210409 RepID=A0A5B7FB68_PORTR|nr:hypothetical protein [Portunus trituberculatus]